MNNKIVPYDEIQEMVNDSLLGRLKGKKIPQDCLDALTESLGKCDTIEKLWQFCMGGLVTILSPGKELRGEE